MTFLNAILLAGAAAFLIPLIIHLLNKRRVTTVQWGAMHLLKEALRQKKRNLKIEQLLLLITRIAIPIILALCLARPVMSFLRQLPGLDKSSLVVVLDNSYSMRAPAEGGSARDKARSDLRQILESLPRGSDVSVILAGQPVKTLLGEPSTLLEEIPKLLEKEPSFAGPLALQEAFQLAEVELKRMGSGAREVLLLSDFQQSDWRNLAEGGSLPALESLSKTEPKPLLTFLRAASDLQENLVMASVTPSAFVVAKEQTVALRALVKNHGQRAYQDLAVHLEADGARIRSTRISVAPNAESVLTLNHAFATAGDHSLTIRVEGDAFPDDNAVSLVLPVREQVSCLLVAGEAGAGPLAGPTDFLEIALTPHQRAQASLKDVIKAGVVPSNQLREKSFEGAEVVVLSNVEKLQGRGFDDLRQFVERGGGLLVFVGPDCDERWYDQEFYRDGKGLFPARLKGFGHVDEGQIPARILSQRHSHPATAYFNDARGMKLEDAAFQHWPKFEKISSESRVLLNLDRGDAFMVEKAFGKGRVIAVAGTANAQWSNLPLQPVFVPLMQRLVTYLATQNAAPQFQPTGSALRVALKPEEKDSIFILTDPLNQTHELKPKSEGEKNVFLNYADTSAPGIYELSNSAFGIKEAPRRFAFNLNAAESDLTRQTPEKMREIATRFGAAYAESHDDYARLDRSRRHGSEVWQPLLLAVLAFLFFEVFLQQRISRA
jgi:hypothetical protein